jgi:hypothetical protein
MRSPLPHSKGDKALARAFRWRKLLATGAYGTIEELAAAERINASYVSRILRPTLLAPDIVALNGKPQGVVSDDQPEARKGQAGRPGVAERFVVPRKPGNTGGGKGPQFKTDAIRGEGPGDWETYQPKIRREHDVWAFEMLIVTNKTTTNLLEVRAWERQ